MKKYIYPITENFQKLSQRPTQSFLDIEPTVKAIFKEVQQKGDAAVTKYTSIFDSTTVTNIAVTQQEFEQASLKVSISLKNAIAMAHNNITTFHTQQIRKPIRVQTQPGVDCWIEQKPIQKVGLYIPGGSAPLFSTVLMLAIPAKLAGCNQIILCTPPNKDGNIDPAILYTAQLCGIYKVYKVGGIQAIAAMTFGTTSIEKVYKIFGPGNQYVTVAKQLATQYNVAIDMPAGPSELLVFADQSARPEFVAADLLSQAEHGPDSQVVLVTTSAQLLEEVQNEINKQIVQLSRCAIALKAIENSKLILVKSNQEAITFINEYGPEHFIVCSTDEKYFTENIINAGSVFIGNYTPESAGDYASGTNHTLPTNGFSKSYSGVTLDSFSKTITFQKITPEGISIIGNCIETMANAEGLQAHKNAVTIRLQSLKDKK